MIRRIKIGPENGESHDGGPFTENEWRSAIDSRAIFGALKIRVANQLCIKT